jgi:hypothetical protein
MPRISYKTRRQTSHETTLHTFRTFHGVKLPGIEAKVNLRVEEGREFQFRVAASVARSLTRSHRIHHRCPGRNRSQDFLKCISYLAIFLRLCAFA